MKSKNTLKRKNTSENIEEISLVDHKAYVWYRENSKLCNRKDVKHFVEYGSIIRLYYEIMAEMLMDSKGGAYIQDFGYIGFLKYFGNHKKSRKYSEGNIRLLTNEDVYYTAFIPIMKSTKSMMYSMDSSYNDTFRERLVKKIKSGYHYMFNASLFFNNKRRTKNRFEKL